MRTGDFSATGTMIYDPLTGNADGTGRTPFPGNNDSQQPDRLRVRHTGRASAGADPAEQLSSTTTMPTAGRNTTARQLGFQGQLQSQQQSHGVGPL